MSSVYYCLITDYSGERATVVSAHGTESAADAAQRRTKYGRVVAVTSDERPQPGLRIWYSGGARGRT